MKTIAYIHTDMKEAEYCRKILEGAEQKIQLYENGELKDAQL